MILKEYTEQVLEKSSTHIDIKKYDELNNIIIGDLVIVENNEIKEVLAVDRYYFPDELFDDYEEFDNIVNMLRSENANG